MELWEEQELQGEILGNHQQSLNSRQAKKENPKESHKGALANKALAMSRTAARLKKECFAHAYLRRFLEKISVLTFQCMLNSLVLHCENSNENVSIIFTAFGM